MCILCTFIAVSCGSTWEFQGNSVNVEVCKKDTLVRAGSIIATPVKPLTIKLP